MPSRTGGRARSTHSAECNRPLPDYDRLISSILESAGRERTSRRFRNVEPAVIDGELLDLPEGSFDAVISHVGLIYFADQQKVLAAIKRVLKPGGRVAAMVYGTADSSLFFSAPVSIIRRRPTC